MTPGARTPEELETLLEDAYLLGDGDALASLFEPGAAVAAGEQGEVRVLQARNTALVIARHGIKVARRGDDGAWRYAIALLQTQTRRRREQEMTQTAEQAITKAVASDEGEARWWFGGLAVIKATAEDTGGRMTIVEMTEPPNTEAPLHVHHREDEAFFVLEGSVTLYVGDEVIAAGPGDYAMGPKDIPHRYTVGPEGVRMLFICLPGGFEKLVREMSAPAESRTLPPPSDEEPDFEHVAKVAQENGAELLA